MNKQAYQVLARKWRPLQFEEVIGQEHVTHALSHALKTNHLHHAYLFTGTRGVGKTTLARIFAKCLNCEAGVSAIACGECSNCKAMQANQFIDLIEVDAASRTKVEDTRDLLDNVQYMPTKGRYKIYLIDEVHMLSGHSFNALLKTLEEPPPHVIFLLATTDPQKLPITVLSRCLQFHLKNMSEDKISSQLNTILTQENITFEQEALSLIANAASGSMRDALSLLEQAIAQGQGQVIAKPIRDMLGCLHHQIMLDLLIAITQNAGEKVLALCHEMAMLSADFLQALKDLLHFLSQIAILQVVPKAPLRQEHLRESLLDLAQSISKEETQLFYQIALTGLKDLPYAPSLRTGFEMLMLRMLAFRPVETQAISQAAAKITSSPNPYTGANHNTDVPGMQAQPLVSSNISQNMTDWPALVSQLKLSGAAQIIATHCILEKQENNTFFLALEKNQAPLLNPLHEKRIAEAISGHLNAPVQVKIYIGSANLATPAELRKQQINHEFQEAEQKLKTDPNVIAILEQFHAKIVPDSITTTNKG